MKLSTVAFSSNGLHKSNAIYCGVAKVPFFVCKLSVFQMAGLFSIADFQSEQIKSTIIIDKALMVCESTDGVRYGGMKNFVP